jgi:hypothetical protein
MVGKHRPVLSTRKQHTNTSITIKLMNGVSHCSLKSHILIHCLHR